MTHGETKAVKVTHIRIKNHIIVDGMVYRVLSCEKSTVGKHGHAKVRLTLEHFVTKTKKSVVIPGHDKIHVISINKQIGQVLSVSSDSLQLMDTTNFDIYEIKHPNYNDIGGQLQSGDEVEVWEALGVKIIKRKRQIDDPGPDLVNYEMISIQMNS